MGLMQAGGRTVEKTETKTLVNKLWHEAEYTRDNITRELETQITTRKAN